MTIVTMCMIHTVLNAGLRGKNNVGPVDTTAGF